VEEEKGTRLISIFSKKIISPSSLPSLVLSDFGTTYAAFSKTFLQGLQG